MSDHIAAMPGVVVKRDLANVLSKIKLWHLLLIVAVIVAVWLLSAPEQPIFPPVCACLKP